GGGGGGGGGGSGGEVGRVGRRPRGRLEPRRLARAVRRLGAAEAADGPRLSPALLAGREGSHLPHDRSGLLPRVGDARRGRRAAPPLPDPDVPELPAGRRLGRRTPPPAQPDPRPALA